MKRKNTSLGFPKTLKESLIARVSAYQTTEMRLSNVRSVVESPCSIKEIIDTSLSSIAQYEQYLKSVYVVENPATAREMQIKANYVAVKLRKEDLTEFVEVLKDIQTLYDNGFDIKKILLDAPCVAD